jgi:hypothetical protein
VQGPLAQWRLEPEQHGGDDAGDGGQAGVAVEFADDTIEVLGAGVVFEEELRGAQLPARGGGLPAAEGVGPGEVTVEMEAGELGPPGDQQPVVVGALAGGGGQVGIDLVDADGVVQPGRVRDAEGAGAVVAELFDG